MKESLTGKKMLDIAVQIEQRGYDFYNFMETNAQSTNLKLMYKRQKERGQKHIADFKKIEAAMDNFTLAKKFDWQESLKNLQEIYDTRLLSNIVDVSSANEFKDEIADVQIAISYEKDKILFMEILRQLLKDIEQDVMHSIIHEDKEWILKLLQTKNSLAK